MVQLSRAVQKSPLIQGGGLRRGSLVHQVSQGHHGVGIAQSNTLLEDCNGIRHVFFIIQQIAAEIVECCGVSRGHESGKNLGGALFILKVRRPPKLIQVTFFIGIYLSSAGAGLNRLICDAFELIERHAVRYPFGISRICGQSIAFRASELLLLRDFYPQLVNQDLALLVGRGEAERRGKPYRYFPLGHTRFTPHIV